MTVGSAHPSSNYESELNLLMSLAPENLKQALHQKNSADLVGLFQATVRPDTSFEPIKQKIFSEIRKQALDPQQMHDVKGLVLAIFPHLEGENEAAFKHDIIEFLKSTVSMENVPELIDFARRNQSKALLDNIFTFLEMQTGASYQCENFGPLTIKFQGSNFKDLQNILPGLRDCIGNDNIRIEIEATSTIDITSLRNFIAENGSLITSSDYRYLNLDEETLQFLLQHSRNLKHLSIKSDTIKSDGIGLQEIKNLHQLQSLNIIECSALENPPDLSGCTQLQSLTLSDCRHLKSPPGLSDCTQLQSLDMSGCWSLASPPNLSGCPQLKSLTMSRCRALTSLPDLSGCTQLQSLNISDCGALTNPPDLSGCPQLQSLDMSGCWRLTSLPVLSGCTQLQILNITGCNVTNPPDLSLCTQLRNLNISDCGALTSPPDLSRCTLLQSLDMSRCLALTSLPNLSSCPQLQILNISGCALTSPPDLSGCPQLRILNINGYTLTSPPDLSGCLQLQSLDIGACRHLTSSPDLSRCTQLESVNMSGCQVLTSPPDLSHSPQLRSLNMSGCLALTSPPDLSKCPRLRILDLNNCLALTSSVHFSFDAMRRLLYLASKFPEVINQDDFKTLFEQQGTILDIIQLPPAAEVDLGPKIEAFQTYLKDKPRLTTLLGDKVGELKMRHQAEQLPLLQFYAYVAGLIDNPDLSEDAFRSYFIGIKSSSSSSSQEAPAGQSIFDLILDYKFTPHRYHFFYNVAKMIEGNMPSDIITRWKNKWTQLVALALIDNVDQDKVNEILSAIDKRQDLRDDIYLQSLISFLIEMSHIAPAENSKIVLDMIISKLTSTMKTPKLLQEFQAYTNISQIYGTVPLDECIRSGGDPTTYFSERFESTFGIQNMEDVSTRYSQTFARFRDSMALFTYWGSLNSLRPTRANSAIKETFGEYLKSVLNGTFFEQRYDNERSGHLKLIFGGKDGERAKEVWRTNRPSQPLDAGTATAKIDYRQKIYEKIVTDGHLKLDEFPLLQAYLLQGEKPTAPLRGEISRKAPVDLKNKFQRELIKLCEGEIDSNRFFKTKQVVDFINKELNSTEFFNDLEALKPSTRTVSSKFTIMETDDPEDLLLSGTEIRGSCQRVNGDPEFNKCLVSYLMNGEIKAITVKSGNNIVARSILRIGWDPTTKRRVILQERVYNNIQGNTKIEEKINEWAIDKAREMNCPLVAAERIGQDTPYPGKVLFRKGLAPFTYSDASGGVHGKDFETKGARVLFDPAVAAASSSTATSTPSNSI